LARIIANTLKREFYEFSAVNTKIKDIENLIIDKNAQQRLTTSPIVFLDEIHRFNKAQQDKLLPHVERGDIVLIGATTENPSFEVIGPLLSRCRVLVLEQLSTIDLKKIVRRALKITKNKIDKKALAFLIEASNGDARVMLNVIEIASQLSESDNLSLSNIEMALQRRQYTFDKHGEDFYNVISAFIKSMRASDVNAALYYLARMVAAGQDPLYIARRMVVFASEDVASPTALVVANSVFQACQQIGYPECQENLAAGTVYLAKAEKDRSAYEAYMSALKDVNNFGNLPIPMNIRNPVTKLMKDVGYGKGYDKYTKESLLPEKIRNRVYYSHNEK
jgi:putative ATPase